MALSILAELAVMFVASVFGAELGTSPDLRSLCVGFAIAGLLASGDLADIVDFAEVATLVREAADDDCEPVCMLEVDVEADCVSDEDVDLAVAVVVVDAVAERKLATGRSVTAVFVPVSGSTRGLEAASGLDLTDDSDENRPV